MKKLLAVLLCLGLAGCATTPGIMSDEFRKELAAKKDWPQDTKQSFIDGKIKLGMTKEEVFFLVGSPLNWSKYTTKDGVFETWSWWQPPVSQAMNSVLITSFDFKDGVLVGYSGEGRYYDKNGTEDLRDYSK